MNEIEEMTTAEIRTELFDIGRTIAQERSIGQVTPCWREERELLKTELRTRN